jgi:hypothetical protein
VRIISILVFIWLLIGVLAAFQRGYFSTAQDNCSSVSTVAVTVVAGPLNYVGANPKVVCQPAKLPQPSK